MNRNTNAKNQLRALLIVSPLLLCLFAFLLPDLPSSPMMKESFWAHKKDAQSIYDVVVLGDSRIYRGVDVGVFEELNPGLQCLNFGFSSAGLDTALLNKAVSLLKPDGRRTLLIGLSSNSFLPSSLLNEHWHSLKSKDEKDRWIKKNLYPHLVCFDPYAISDAYKFWKGEGYYENFHLKTGYVASLKRPLDSSSALEAYRHQFEKEQMEVEDILRFKDCLMGLKNSGIEIILLRVPVSYEMKRLEDEMNFPNSDQVIGDLAALGFKTLNINYPGLNTYDGSHLDSASALVLSKKLAKEFRK